MENRLDFQLNTNILAAHSICFEPLVWPAQYTTATTTIIAAVESARNIKWEREGGWWGWDGISIADC